MRSFWLAAAVGSLVSTLVGCSGGGAGISSAGSYNPGYGPFDRRGNYVDEWADKPAKKHSWADHPASAPATPSTGAVASSKPSATPAATPAQTRPATSPTQVASMTRPAPRPTAPSTTTRPAAPVVSAAPSPKPTTVKPKSPPPVRHTVKTGDTLYSLSRRYGTTVSAIQRANGLKGTTIITGKTYLIPR